MAAGRTVRVALAGCGAVGSELVRALAVNADSIEREHGVRFDVVRVLVRTPAKPRPVTLRTGVLTADLDAFLATDADVVIEAIGGLDPAGRIASSAVARGLPFVTANKALIAVAGDELGRAAQRSGASLWLEATVGGGVPVVRVLRDYLASGTVRRVRGILNGTCNFVLTQLERGVPYVAAIEEARRRGFAEADPSRDLDGRDAADKIAILAWLAFGVAPAGVRVRRRGILPDPDRLVRGADAVGGRVRLLAECHIDDHGVSASVEPVVLPPDSPFARTVHEQNRIAVDAGWSLPLELAGPGAGGGPTAAALLADLIQATTSRVPRRLALCHLPSAVNGSGPTLAAAQSAHRARVDERATWLVGVAGQLARRARVLLESADIPAVPVAAGGDDLWLCTGPAACDAVESVLARLEPVNPAPLIVRIQGAAAEEVAAAERDAPSAFDSSVPLNTLPGAASIAALPPSAFAGD